MRLIDRWNKFLSESREYDQSLYKSDWTLKILKRVGGDKTQTLAEIRAIPNVTTVFKSSEGFENLEYFESTFDIKFVLKTRDSPDLYIKQVLRKDLKEIPGLQIISYGGHERIK